jgi:L-2-hydroxyglutarate oxidase LhgO
LDGAVSHHHRIKSHIFVSALTGNPRIGVIGAGIIGLAVARRLTQLCPDASITVIEKEAAIATHQTGRNSGVAHAGLYYPPGSLKADLCARGRGLLHTYCEERDLPYDECGKLVVALDDSEIEPLRAIEKRAQANSVPGLRWLDGGQLTEVEPHAAGIAALHSPHTAIVDFVAVAHALAADVTAAGGQVHLNCPVTGIVSSREGIRVEIDGLDDGWEFDRLVICAGLYADRLARQVGDTEGPQIIPFRGEYLRLTQSREHLVRGLIYPVPDPRYPFLGVHFTRRVNGSVDVGPNAVLALAREGYRWRDVRFGDGIEMLRWPGFRPMATQHWRAGAFELWGSVWRRAMVNRARRYVPELRLRDVQTAPAGVRAQAVDADGALVDDFRMGVVGGGADRKGRIVTVRNAPSPAATSSLAIAERVAALVLED